MCIRDRVPTGTGFRDHYRTRVKKNIDFGEIGSSVGLGGAPGPLDADMEALLTGSMDPAAGEHVLAATGSDAVAPAPEAGALLEEEPKDSTESAE